MAIKSEDSRLLVCENRPAHEERHLSLLILLQEMQQFKDFGIGQILNPKGHWFGLHLNSVPSDEVRLLGVITLDNLWLNFLGQQCELPLVLLCAELVHVVELNVVDPFELVHDFLEVAAALPGSACGEHFG